MPGKHAPASPKSFYLSLARAGSVVAVAIGVLVAIVMVATGGNSKPRAQATVPSSPSSSQAAAGAPSGSVLPVPSVDVLILNGTGRQGLAKSVAVRVTAVDGFSASVGGNAAPTDTTTIYVRDGANEAAERLRRAAFGFMSPDAIKVATATSPAVRQRATLTVVLGLDYPEQPSPVRSESQQPAPARSESQQPAPTVTA